MTRAGPRLKGPNEVIWVRHKRLRRPRCCLLCLLGRSRWAFAHPCHACLDVKDWILQPTLKDKCCVLARNIAQECTSPEIDKKKFQFFLSQIDPGLPGLVFLKTTFSPLKLFLRKTSPTSPAPLVPRQAQSNDFRILSRSQHCALEYFVMCLRDAWNPKSCRVLWAGAKLDPLGSLFLFQRRSPGLSDGPCQV